MFPLSDSRISTLSCRLVWNGCSELDTTWDFEQHDLSWRIYRNLDDGAALICADGQISLRRNQVVVVPPHTALRTICTTSGVRHAWLCVIIPELTADVVHRLVPRPLEVISDPWWEDVFSALPLLESSPPHLLLLTQALACLAVSRALATIRPTISSVEPDTNHTTLDERSLEPAVTWIREHSESPLQVATLARRCNLSPTHFSRLFRRSYGMSPMAWQRSERVRLAADLLLRSTLTIDHIAAQCGFTNRYHFSRVFTQLTGTSPVAFRRSRNVP